MAKFASLYTLFPTRFKDLGKDGLGPAEGASRN